jgi:G3E family GTPase
MKNFRHKPRLKWVIRGEIQMEIRKTGDTYAKQPVKVIFIGGFLGAGKTTLIRNWVFRLLNQGLKVGIVTNDQSQELVDTFTLKGLGVPTEEVAGGCFCCRFNDLLGATEKVLSLEPDLLLCEPVGSCTDFVAAVIAPLKLYYGDVFHLSPFPVLVDPIRCRDFLSEERKTNFPQEVAYIFRKQIEEADVIAINKIDMLEEKELKEISTSLEKISQGKPIYKISALSGEGIEDLLNYLLAGTLGSPHILQEINYEIYARGEASLGWLNTKARIDGRGYFHPLRFAQKMMTNLRTLLLKRKAEVAHLKFILLGEGGSVRAHLTKTEAEPTYIVDGETDKIKEACLILNARVFITPPELTNVIGQAFANISKATNCSIEIQCLQSFTPPKPNPKYRLNEV